jgi:hypothetical protein
MDPRMDPRRLSATAKLLKVMVGLSGRFSNFLELGDTLKPLFGAPLDLRANHVFEGEVAANPVLRALHEDR